MMVFFSVLSFKAGFTLFVGALNEIIYRVIRRKVSSGSLTP